ncbi:hypothetical protein [Streptomyces mangrovisoli]|uniref:Tetratricopeptide repeat protein n=1 Tax=Streptomyces mangrovisoli TaxID=1428628 RepID=A0A1J4NQP0_9ACTN|nr:hypothetical protein [Streptomyces mangrovisoli]OIJ64753.1 hypothetical protein WN71_027020 [Streptomyces mangrovisoli]
MSHTEQELRTLYQQALAMPRGSAQFAALEQVMRHADARGLVEFAFEVRMQATRVFQLSWVPAKALLAYSWCRAAYDREPERFGARAEHRLLWNIKWMIYSVHQFPEIPLRSAYDLLDDMERRYRRGGHSMHAVLQHRGLIAGSVGELDRAQDYYEQMDRSRRDPLSDCAGCVPSSHVRTLVALGRDEDAIRVGEPARTSSCSDQPQWINSELLLPYVRTGQVDKALDAHRSAYRRIRDNPYHLPELALNLLFCTHTGNTARGLDLVERHLPWLDNARTPLAEMEFAAAAVAVLNVPVGRGEGGLTLRFPATEGRRRPDSTVADLAAELRRRAEDIAARFDARNGNGHQGDRIRDWMASGPIGAPVALSVFAPSTGAVGGAPRDLHIRGLIERVAAATAAGDPTGAARARLAAAQALLETERTAEAVEAAEEAIRELDRLGLAEESARCELLLAHAYHRDGQRGEAVKRLRGLLERPDGIEPAGESDRARFAALLGEWLVHGPEASRWYAVAARSYAASGRTAERLAALTRALRHGPAPEATAGLLADAEAALTEPDLPAEERAHLLSVCARVLLRAGRTTEAAKHLSAARDLLSGPSVTPSAECVELLGEVLSTLAAIHLHLGDPGAARATARAAIDVLDPDDPWDETHWNAAVLLVRSLRELGELAEAERLTAEYEVEEDDLETVLQNVLED